MWEQEEFALRLKKSKHTEPPASIADVRRFLGMVNQQSKYIPQLAEKTEPLRALLRKENLWVWGQQQQSFDQVKKEMAKTPVLALYDVDRETVVSADASSFGLEAVLRQKLPNGEEKIVAYASRSIAATERTYAQVEKEAIGITWAVEKFASFLIGKPFSVETDHKPLVPLLSNSKGLDELPPRIQRFRMRLFRFQFQISHVDLPGKDLITPFLVNHCLSTMTRTVF